MGVNKLYFHADSDSEMLTFYWHNTPKQVKLNKLFILFSLYFLGQFLNFFRIRIQNKICTPIMAQTTQKRSNICMLCRIDVLQEYPTAHNQPIDIQKVGVFCRIDD